MRRYLGKSHPKKSAGGVDQSVDPEFKPYYCKKKKNQTSILQSIGL
jgi:hypothetical protein